MRAAVGRLRLVAPLGLACLAVACGPSDTIDVTGPAGPPASARSDAGPPPAPEGPGEADGPTTVTDAGAATTPDGPANGRMDVPPPPDVRVPPPPGSNDASSASDARVMPPDSTPVVDARPSPPDASPAACPPAPANDEIIALFEDGSPLVTRMVGGRGGTSWNLINDDAEGASATITAVDVPLRCGSRRALRFAGTSTPAEIPIARFAFVQGSAQFYDARAYQGVRLALRAAAPSKVGVKISDRNTSVSGGQCTLCSDHFFIDLDVTTDWKVFTVPFATLKQLGIGDREDSVDEANVFGVEMVARNLRTFELFIDDVTFFR
jgi:hypothetical protein